MRPVLLIDFDGTLCFDRFWRSAPSTVCQKIQELVFGADQTLLEEWMLGRYTSEEVNRWLATNLLLDGGELWKIFVHDCQTMTVSLEVLESIRSMRTRYFTVLLTDNMDCFDRFTVPALGLDRYFDAIINSSRARRLKSSPHFFEDLMLKFNGDITHSILIDDSERACADFEKAGGAALRVTSESPAIFHLKTALSVH